MQLHISPEACSSTGPTNDRQRQIDRARVGFIVRSKFRKATRGRFLGYLWLVLDPLIISLIYLFVFSVVKSNPNASSILLGVTMYRVFQSSLLKGLACIRELNGGFKAERISTSVVLRAEIAHRLIDVFLQSVLIAVILVLAFGTEPLDGLIFLGIAQAMGFLMFGLGVLLSPYTNLIPDLQNVISYGLRLGFYASPAMYPMARMEGFHYRVNQYNPFAYFVEFGRYLANVDSTFLDLNPNFFAALVVALLLLTVVGLRRVDGLRWRMTTWS
ncbi:MAG: hypothetical protein DWC07_04435 [Candidatus Poseidoniales archaeon]|nr:MAG: hypothetical protein DWC07_04435 [Candidatus Poseidoniales archaeon]